jgi:hypothetical protein
MISAASEAKIVDLENIPEKTLDRSWKSIDITKYTLSKIQTILPKAHSTMRY